jgi:hypothetical protein
MLSITGTSYAPESIPLYSGNSIDTQHKRLTRDLSSSADSGIVKRNHTILLIRICDVVLIGYSVTEFLKVRRDGIRRNWKEFLVIPTDSGIPGTSSHSVIARILTSSENWRNAIKFRVGPGCYVPIEFPELNEIDVGVELIPRMFNIAE